MEIFRWKKELLTNKSLQRLEILSVTFNKDSSFYPQVPKRYDVETIL